MIHSLPVSLVEDVESLLLEKKDHLIKRLRNLTDEQKQEVIDFFRKKPNLENRIDWNRRDLTYEDFLEVMDVERNMTKSQRRRLVKSSGIRGLRKDRDYIPLEAPEGVDAYIPLNYEASKLIACKDVGSGVGAWCTAWQRSAEHWDEFTDQNDVMIYILYPNTKEAIRYSRSSNSVMEIRDGGNNSIEETDIHRTILDQNMRAITSAKIDYDEDNVDRGPSEEEIYDMAYARASSDFSEILINADPFPRYLQQVYRNVLKEYELSLLNYVEHNLGNNWMNDSLIKGLKDESIAQPKYGWSDKDAGEFYTDKDQESVQKLEELIDNDSRDLKSEIRSYFYMVFWSNSNELRIKEIASEHMTDLPEYDNDEDDQVYWIPLLADKGLIRAFEQSIFATLSTGHGLESFWELGMEYYLHHARRFGE